MTTAITAAFLLGLIGYALSVSGGRAASGEPPRATGESSPQNPEPLVDYQALAERRLAMAHRYELQRNQLRKMLRSMRRAERRRWTATVDSTLGIARAFLCIHRFEGSWTDTGAPYWGGLQMDYSFQRTYGGPLLGKLGTADHWPAAAQIAVGMVAFYSGRGFYPWPNTARACGLL